MLVGPSTGSSFPTRPHEGSSFREILLYLQDLERSISRQQSSIVAFSVGFLGLRGLSSTGTTAQNFNNVLSISNVTSVTWTFTSFEADASYMIFAMPTVTASTMITSLSQTTSTVSFNFSAVVPSGINMNVLLLR